MLMRKTIGMLVISLMIAGGQLALATAAQAAPRRCGYFDIGTGKYVACAGTTASETTGGSPTRQVGMGSATTVGTNQSAGSHCSYTYLASPPASDPAWSKFLPPGADPADYRLEMSSCRSGGVNSAGVVAVPIRSNPPPDPQVVAREAVARLPIPLPDIGVGPNIQRVAVNIPVWLWVSNPGAVSASATDRTVTVTATAALRSVTWSMGEPAARPFTCQGGGVAPWAGADLWHPPCGYTYRLRSLPSRTGGAGVWQVTAAAAWAITWQANTGQSGTDTVTTRSTLGLNVGEYRTVIVAGNG